jgi:hypothetical protein
LPQQFGQISRLRGREWVDKRVLHDRSACTQNLSSNKILQRQGPEADRLLVRLDQLPPDDIATTIVSFQEQLQGWLAFLKGACGDQHLLPAYVELDKIRRAFQKMNVLSAPQALSAKPRTACPLDRPPNPSVPGSRS